MTLGRVFTIFTVNTRFAVTPRRQTPIVVGGRRAVLMIADETTAVECTDLGNSIVPIADKGKWAYRLSSPLVISEDANLDKYQNIRTFMTMRLAGLKEGQQIP